MKLGDVHSFSIHLSRKAIIFKVTVARCEKSIMKKKEIRRRER